MAASLRTASPGPTQASDAGPAGPEGPERGSPFAEVTMGVAVFMVLAFVMLGVDRLVKYTRSHYPRHHVPQR
jgi:hypothetical protein